jgi:nicotinate-nucleotide pyrophosphorylase (carboxylating)
MSAHTPETLDPDDARRVIRQALAEDVGAGDITTLGTVPAAARARGIVIAREAGVLAGLPLVGLVFDELGAGEVTVQAARGDGDRLDGGDIIAHLEGPARALLTGERLALNLLQRLSGVATLTRRFVDAIAGTGARVLDTRKTTPGLRTLQKYAVRMGGGANHRMGLWDEGLVKDNHIACLARGLGVAPHEVDLAAAVDAIRALRPGCFVEIEVADARALERVIAAGPDAVLLDNMPPEQLAAAVRRARALAAGRGREIVLEASGGITLETARAMAETGVDRLSVGALTHSAPALDVALDFEVT